MDSSLKGKAVHFDENYLHVELAARLEEEINAPLDLVPLTPSHRFTQMIERRGRRLI